MSRTLKIQIIPQLGETNVFTVQITARNEDNTYDEEVAVYTDISGLSGVFAQLSTWAELFTATGGAHLWTFVYSPSANYIFEYV